ncbi:MAG: hypothetical protein A3G24_19855 [Betaproteobacteria bacterium RIFCSPLOWO2_12_FULL_62_13]|nr:MAG: hypothetical protein A3G24_19855 [Betaproteobacteria bacterium RIFCSPLOWO2_12_FULL_62_13]
MLQPGCHFFQPLSAFRRLNLFQETFGRLACLRNGIGNTVTLAQQVGRQHMALFNLLRDAAEPLHVIKTRNDAELWREAIWIVSVHALHGALNRDQDIGEPLETSVDRCRRLTDTVTRMAKAIANPFIGLSLVDVFSLNLRDARTATGAGTVAIGGNPTGGARCIVAHGDCSALRIRPPSPPPEVAGSGIVGPR